MSFTFLSVVFAAFLVVNHGLADSSVVRADKLKFSIYITSSCSDTQHFIVDDFYRTYQEFKDSLDIEFVPWGKSVRQSDGSITCQFGPADCLANRIQSCALFILGEDQEKQAEYINCEFTTLSSISQSYYCAELVGIPDSVTKQCFDSSFADELQAEDERKTGEIVMNFVPTIVYNDSYDLQNQNDAFGDFRQFVCGLLKQNDPNACA